MKLYRKDQTDELLSALADRAENISPDIMNTVADVIANVRKNGDAALREYTEKFDKVKLDGLYLSDAEKAKLAKYQENLAGVVAALEKLK